MPVFVDADIHFKSFLLFNFIGHGRQFFGDENTCHLFTQVTGYQILLDLLYENEKYDELLNIYGDLNANGRLHRNKYIDVIVLATYYRLVSLKYACDVNVIADNCLWNKIKNSNTAVLHRIHQRHSNRRTNYGHG